MHSKLLELIGSMTITSASPPSLALSKQCDKPCDCKQQDSMNSSKPSTLCCSSSAILMHNLLKEQ